MTSGNLFRPFLVWFSLRNKKHVKIMQKFNDEKLHDGKTKKQVVMDALEHSNDTKVDKLIKKQFLEQRLEQFK